MGIRLSCPNGHPLHVKTELAGKRGICPQCQARFVIPHPTVTNGSAPTTPAPTPVAPPTPPAATAHPAARPAATPAPQPAAPAAAPAAVPVANVAPAAVPAGATPPVMAPPAGSPPPAAAIPQAVPQGVPLPTMATPPQLAWYVRPAAGGQYGPADEALLRQWVAERRVDGTALVWCTGWPDWRKMSDLAHLFPGLSGPVLPAGVSLPASEGGPASGSPAAVATARYIRRKKKSANSQLIAAVVLLVLALVLGGVLLWVLNKDSAPSPSAAPPTDPAVPTAPESTNAPAADADDPAAAAEEME